MRIGYGSLTVYFGPAASAEDELPPSPGRNNADAGSSSGRMLRG
jgi:hypothetical protein